MARRGGRSTLCSAAALRLRTAAALRARRRRLLPQTALLRTALPSPGKGDENVFAGSSR